MPDARHVAGGKRCSNADVGALRRTLRDRDDDVGGVVIFQRGDGGVCVGQDCCPAMDVARLICVSFGQLGEAGHHGLYGGWLWPAARPAMACSRATSARAALRAFNRSATSLKRFMRVPMRYSATTALPLPT